MTVIWADIEVPEHAWNAIKNAKAFTAGDAIPDALLVAVAHLENGTFDCSRQSEYIDRSRAGQAGFDSTGREMSFGLFQLNVDGVGHGFTPEQLQDCDMNAGIAVREIARRLAKGDSLYDAISPWSVRDTAWKRYQANPYVYVDDRRSENQPPVSTPPTKSPIQLSGTTKQLTMQDIVIIGSLAAIALIALISMGNKQTGQIVIQRGGEA